MEENLRSWILKFPCYVSDHLSIRIILRWWYVARRIRVVSIEELGMSGETERMVSCPNCEGEGFLNTFGTVGITVPCPVCLTEGVVRESDAVHRADS